MTRVLLGVGLGALAVGAGTLLWAMHRLLGYQDPRDLLAQDEVERGGGEPYPRPAGRHRASP